MARRGKPAVVSWGGDRLDVFVRTERDELLHQWSEGTDGATERIGGPIASDPVAAAYGEDLLSVFVLSPSQSLLHWSWNPGDRRMHGPDDWGRLATPPMPISWQPGQLDVLARSIDVRGVRRWILTSEGELTGPLTMDVGSGVDPVPVSHMPGKLDVLFGSGGLQHRLWNGSDLVVHANLDGNTIARPVTVSWGRNRIDVFARTTDGIVTHWGFDGRITDRWFGPEPAIRETLVANPAVVSRGEDELDMFARTANGTLLHWQWNAGTRVWIAHGARVGTLVSDPVAISRAPGLVEVFAWLERGAMLSARWDGRDFAITTIAIADPPRDEVPWETEDQQAPAVIIRRPRDHVVLGVHWSDCNVIDEVPPKLEPASGGARVVLTFPPQHIAEEVAPGEGTPEPTLNPGATGGFRVWQSRLARASRVAIAGPAGRIPLTSEGLLGALNKAPVLPGTRNPNDNVTSIELPWGLIVSPEADPPTARIHARHRSAPLAPDSGTTGLWSTKLQPADPATSLVVRTLNPGGPDPFPLPLNHDNRLTIFALQTPASATRLELTSLGGSLSVAGRWRSFEWDHEAAVGRDQTVRTVVKGVLYPLGHRAEYVELTERLIDSSDAIAVLRKKWILNITEPIRYESEAGVSRAFPFSEVEITTLTYSGLHDPGSNFPPELEWQRHPRQALQEATLQEALERTARSLRDLQEEVQGDMGWGGIGPVIEDLADTDENAAECLRLQVQVDQILSDLEALKELGDDVELVPVFFWPADGLKPIQFPVRLRAANGDVHVQMPLIFAADLELSGDLREPFRSLSHPDVLARLEEQYRTRDAGVVTLPGTPIDLVRSSRSTRSPGDVLEVHGLHFVPTVRNGRFSPRLGQPVVGRRSAADAWGFKVGVPAMRSLLGTDPAAARVALAYAESFEAIGDAEDLAFEVAGDALDINFTGASDRSGGLVAPKLEADAISRAHGLVNAAGARSLDPAELLSEGASLLGFELRDLVTQITTPPAIVSELRRGQPPLVRMTWEDVLLKAFPGEGPAVFSPRDGSKLTMKVVSSPTLNETTCDLGKFSLFMPPGADPLLELSFESLKFTQIGGQPPTLRVGKIDATFMGKLTLLQVLQDSVGFGAAGPGIDVSPSGITARYSLPVPPVGLLAFTMYNLVFNAGVTVPFNGDPVGVSIGFGSRERPFTLTVMALGGGGYVDLEIIHTRLRRMEISLEFGAAVSISVGIATAEVHAFGGIRFALQSGGSVTLTGYIRLGGTVDVLGLISVTVELRVELDYRFDTNSLVGRALLVIEIDLTLYSDSIEVDSGDWVISGGDPRQRIGGGGTLREVDGLAVWTEYLGKFQS